MNVTVFGATGAIGHATPAVLDPHEQPTPVTRLIGFMPRTFMRRNPEDLAAHAARGLRTAAIDLDDVPGTAATLTGVDKLLVSFGDMGSRVARHGNAIEAARRPACRT